MVAHLPFGVKLNKKKKKEKEKKNQEKSFSSRSFLHSFLFASEIERSFKEAYASSVFA